MCFLCLTVFMKNKSSLCHPNDSIIIPYCAADPPEVDYECELAVTIGRDAKNVRVEDALSYVLGYTVGNDVSARRWQGKKMANQWVRAKSFDTFCPLGPRLVLARDIPDPQNLEISTTVNGQVLQSSNTRDMIFSVAEIVSFLSQETTLMAGTVILTGTPQGVGFTRKPPIFLKPGDNVTVSIGGIGHLSNNVVQSSSKL
jgi:2-keto-4-pentenoate hydratase/2-oxohepta-3-ene-1,7-dioic acid hydratase in catechol pathway